MSVLSALELLALVFGTQIGQEMEALFVFPKSGLVHEVHLPIVHASDAICGARAVLLQDRVLLEHSVLIFVLDSFPILVMERSICVPSCSHYERLAEKKDNPQHFYLQH